jgi:hypothetical protein
MNNHSYVQTALNQIAGYKTRDGDIAIFIERIVTESPEIKTIFNAIAVAHDRTVMQSTDHKFNGGPAPVANPIAFLDFVQTIMNKVCSLARKDAKGKRVDDFGNGVDFSQDLTDQLGFSVDPKLIPELVDEDFRILYNVHAYIAQGMPYLTDISPLHYHAENVKLDDDTWVKENIADSYEFALSILDTKADSYVTELADIRMGESANMDFAGTLKDTPDSKRTAKRLATQEKKFASDLAKRKAASKKVAA